MTVVNPRPDLIWYWELRDDDAVRYVPQICREFPEQQVIRHENYWAARRAIDQARKDGNYPWFVLSDSVGLEEDGTNPSAAATLQADCPLALVYLFSSSAFARSLPIEEWKRLRLIVEACAKSNGPKMLGDAARFRQNWDRISVSRFREFIIHESDNPTAKYFPSDDGRDYLSLIDIHQEIVQGTPLGIEQESAWEKTLSGDMAIFE